MNLTQTSLADNIIISFVRKYGLIPHQIIPMNDFYTNGIHRIFNSNTPIIINSLPMDSEQKKYDSVSCEIYFKNVIMETPSVTNFSKHKKEPIFPTETLAKRSTYSSNIKADIEFILKASKNKEVVSSKTRILENKDICAMPVMVKTNKCNLFGLNKEGLRMRNEDPESPGGDYVIRGQEYFVNTTEASAPNIHKTFRGNKSDDYLAKSEFTSKDGFDNQTNYRITTMIGKNKIVYIIIECGIFKEIRIPLPVFITAVSLKQPFKEILEKICYDQKTIENVCQLCWYEFEEMLDAESEVAYARQYIAKLVGKKLSEEVTNEYITKISVELERIFETCCLTILGKSKSASLKKLDYIYRMVFWTISAGLSPTDELIDNRDISIIKRFVSPAASIAKTTKNAYTNNIVKQFTELMKGAFSTSKFENIEPEKIFKNKQKDIANDFLVAFSRTINAGGNLVNKDGTVVYKNQMKTGMALHKNKLCIISQARAVDGNSFGDNAVSTSSRNKEFRRNEQSLTGGICPIHSATESSNVGTKKQLSCSSMITRGESDEEIIELLKKEDLDFETYLHCNPLKHMLIYVNGLAIGKTKDNDDKMTILKKFNEYKRLGLIPRMTSILYISTRNELNFFTDGGRIVRPVIPVVENKILLQDSDLGYNTCDFDKLLAEGKIVYLSVDEAPTYRVATSLEEFVDYLDSPLDNFNFVEIPSGIFSLAVATAPNLQYNQVARTVYQSSQARQSAGEGAPNSHLRYDKEVCAQFYIGKPTIKTIVWDFGIMVGGVNINIAIFQTTSDNQDDAIIVRKGSIDSGMMSMTKQDSIKVPVDSKEKLGIDKSILVNSLDGNKNDPFQDIDPDTGITRRNTKIGPDQKVLVAKSIKVAETIGGIIKNETKNKSFTANNKYEFEYVDHTNKCEIDGVINVQISTIKSRNLEIGDKLSTRAGQKGIIGRICENNEMPYTVNGDMPDIVFNSHGFNTRMTIGMIIEGLFALIGSKLCIYIDGTVFSKVPELIFFKEKSDAEKWIKDLEYEYRNYPEKQRKAYIKAAVEAALEIRKQLEDNDFDTHTMISGLNGEVIKGKVVMIRIFEQRLLKVVKDAFYVATDTNTDIHTRQPAAGSKESGGLRLGEMEIGNLVAHGCSNFLGEKQHIHSDGIMEYICRCGLQANYNHETKTSYCSSCKEKTDMVEMQGSFSTTLLVDKLLGTGIEMKRVPESYKLYEILSPKII